MQLMAETMRAKGYDAQAAAFNTDFRSFTNDYQIKTQKIPLQRFLFSLRAIYHYDVFHFFWGISLLDFWKFYNLDLPLLRKLNKKIVVHFRGTDLVNIHYYTYLSNIANDIAVPTIPKSRPDQLLKLERWRRYSHRLLVSTPDLLEIVPEATLVQQVVDTSMLRKISDTQRTEAVLRIAHAPTRRNAKGTDAIIRAVENLKKESCAVELDLIENESPDNVLKRFSACDIGIDQLLSGWYGKVGVELMAMGKPVLCHIDPRFDKFRPDLPIIRVTKDNLEDTLRKLTHKPAWLRNVSGQSLRFAEKNHNVNTVVDELLEMYACINV